MWRRVLYILLAATICLNSVGCKIDNPFEPKTEFFGYVKDSAQWRLFVPQPSDITKVHDMSPGSMFNDYLVGSRIYHFEARFENGQVYSSFDARVNNISSDSGADGLKTDWYWDIGGGYFQAAPGMQVTEVIVRAGQPPQFNPPVAKIVILK